MRKAFDTINIHTLIRKLLQTNIPGTIITFIVNYIKGAKPTQHIETTHPDNVNLKQASFHPHYLTFTLQTYHHPVHRFKSWPTQVPSHPYTQARVQPRNTYIKFLHGPCRYTSNLDLKINNNALPMATHPKVLGLTLDPKLTYP